MTNDPRRELLMRFIDHLNSVQLMCGETGFKFSIVDSFLSTLPPSGEGWIAVETREKPVSEQMRDIWKPGEQTLWGCYMEGTDELGISDDILLSVHSTPAGAHENSVRMQKEYGGKHYTDKVVIHS